MKIKWNIFKLIFVLSTCLLFACTEKNISLENDNNNIYYSDSLSRIVHDFFLDCQYKIFAKGDTSCYNLGKRYVKIEKQEKEFLFWSLIMANKHNYKTANLDVFNVLLDSYVKGRLEYFYDIDSVTQSFMLEYLNKAYSDHIPEAINIKNNLDSIKNHSNLDNRKNLFDKSFSSSTYEDEIFYFGNVEFYNFFCIKYTDYTQVNLLFWSLFMANKYDYVKAHLNVYYILNDYHLSFDEIDTETKKLMLYHLEKASEIGRAHV